MDWRESNLGLWGNVEDEVCGWRTWTESVEKCVCGEKEEQMGVLFKELFIESFLFSFINSLFKVNCLDCAVVF